MILIHFYFPPTASATGNKGVQRTSSLVIVVTENPGKVTESTRSFENQEPKQTKPFNKLTFINKFQLSLPGFKPSYTISLGGGRRKVNL